MITPGEHCHCTDCVPDLTTLDGETASCQRCGRAIIGDGPYEVVEPTHPTDGNPHVARLPSAAFRVVRVLDEHGLRSEIVVGFVPSREMATRIAALLNFAHKEG